MDSSLIEAAAQHLRVAAATVSPCSPVRDLLGPSADTSAGYAVQQHNTEHFLAEGRRLSGHKVGLTNEAVQEQLNMDEPIWGVLFADRCGTDGDETGDAGLIEPRVEVEVAVVLGADLDKGEHCVVDVISAVDYVLPALEIVDSRIAGWDMNIVDMIADKRGQRASTCWEPNRCGWLTSTCAAPRCDWRSTVSRRLSVRASPASAIRSTR